MIQALLHARKKIFGSSCEKTQMDGQMNLFDSVQELASELFKEQEKITVKSYKKSPRKPGVRKEMLAGLPKDACLGNSSYDAMPQSIVPVSPELMNDNSQPASKSGLEVSVNNLCIHVTNETSPELLLMVLQVAANVK